VRKELTPADLGDLLDLPRVAVLATYRRNGTVLLSPVWHEWHDDGFNVLVGPRDVKVAHLRRDPRASLVVYEDGPPYRGIEVRATAQLIPQEDKSVLERMATRYFGPEAGRQYAASVGESLLVRLEPGELRVWDFADDF
jgi:PPOX class probable F420-dependent enzyme